MRSLHKRISHQPGNRTSAQGDPENLFSEMPHNLIVFIHLMAIIIFVLHNITIEYNQKKQVTRLQLGNDNNEINNPRTQDTQSYTKSEISLETILTARSIIILMRWTRQWI